MLERWINTLENCITTREHKTRTSWSHKVASKSNLMSDLEPRQCLEVVTNNQMLGNKKAKNVKQGGEKLRIQISLGLDDL